MLVTVLAGVDEDKNVEKKSQDSSNSKALPHYGILVLHKLLDRLNKSHFAWIPPFLLASLEHIQGVPECQATLLINW